MPQGVLGSAAGVLLPVCSWQKASYCAHSCSPAHLLEGGTKDVLEPKCRHWVPACFPQWVHLQAGMKSQFSSYNSALDSLSTCRKPGLSIPCALAADLDWSQHSQEMMDDPGSSLAV